MGRPDARLLPRADRHLAELHAAHELFLAVRIHAVREHGRRGELLIGALDELDELAAVEHRDEVQRAMTVLSDEERDAIALRFGGDMTVPEIAKLLKEPLPRVEGRVYRSLRKLREELD